MYAFGISTVCAYWGAGRQGSVCKLALLDCLVPFLYSMIAMRSWPRAFWRMGYHCSGAMLVGKTMCI